MVAHLCERENVVVDQVNRSWDSTHPGRMDINPTGTDTSERHLMPPHVQHKCELYDHVAVFDVLVPPANHITKYTHT